MRQFRTQGIILSRTDYGEADRILTFLTPDHGKVRAIAKGVRRSKSKLAGGIELFSVSDISFIPGKREISTVVSTRLIKHYGDIVKDLDRTNAGYGFIKKLDKATEDAAGTEYFQLMREALAGLDNKDIGLDLLTVWFDAQLLRLGGHSPNLRSDRQGEKLRPGDTYDFDFDAMSFTSGETYGSDDIKFLRLLFSDNSPNVLRKIKGADKLSVKVRHLVQPMLQTYVRI